MCMTIGRLSGRLFCVFSGRFWVRGDIRSDKSGNLGGYIDNMLDTHFPTFAAKYVRLVVS